MASLAEIEYNEQRYKIAFVPDTDTINGHPTWYSHLDEKVVREKFWKIGKDDLVLDIGAAYGSYTLSALLSGAKRAYAWSPECGGSYEASEKAFLDASLALNGWSDKAVVYDTGFFDKTGWLDTMAQKFYPELPMKKDVENPFFFIKVEKLDDWYNNVFLKSDHFNQYNNVWIKIDVESAECEVLNGGKQLLADAKANILIENHIFKKATIADEVKEILISLGYIHCETTPYHSVSHSLYQFPK